ncbi:hypothetical protein BGZ65_009924 [Modicella reniformis]|uniref:Uncharacterized protein n=1 Tax=Modicella reniformis TaxID=1440133 RepID=A0A9P6LRJ0_9FUNG|nr:hypothetical protein BGZ65_009924 [Modicella reniformis]
MKHGFSQRMELGLEEDIQRMMSKDSAARIYVNIVDTRTFPIEYYNPCWASIDNHGTAHVSVVDKNDMAVSLSSTPS